MDEVHEMIRNQIKLLAKISSDKDTTTSEVIECSVVMGDLCRALSQ